MGQTNILTKEAFEQDKTLKSKFGSYENYTTSFQQGGTTENNAGTTPQNSEQPASMPTENSQDYTMDDVASVAETGSLPPTEPKSAYDMYMEEAKSIYNQGVEQNNKSAANQAASAGAEYRELNRNVGEINKANGRANTGYAGDTSIDAYNAYRNSVNESYANADKANNDLYSYYLSEMTKLQQAKDTKEATDRQLEMQKEEFEYNKEMTDRQMELQEREYNDNKAREVAEHIEVIKGENPYDSDGKIKPTIARKIYEYLLDVYGEAENIPDSIIANVNTENGFKEYVDAYNNGEAETLEKDQKNKEKVENIVAGNETIQVNYGTTNEQYSGGYLRSGEFKLGEKLSNDDSVLYTEEFKTALKDLDYFTNGDAKSERLKNGYTVRVDTKNGWYYEVVLSSIYGFFTGGKDIADPYDHNYYTYYDGNWYKSSKVG